MDKVLVTGGAGYIGSVLVPQLLEKSYQVTVLDNFRYKQNSLLDVCHSPKLKIIVDDVRNKVLLKKEVSSHDIIIPLAAIVGAAACDRDQILAKLVNYDQISNINKWVSSNQKIIFPVTNSGYGIGKKDIYCDEYTELNPISLYGKTKVDAEKVLLDSKNAVTLRLATVFGCSTRMRMDLLVNDFVYKAITDKCIVLFESQFKRNYIHIRDISYVMLHSINKYEYMRGKPFNVGLSDANLSKMELCLRIKNQIKDLQILECELGQDPDKRDYIVSNERIEQSGWRPKYSIDDGISELIKMYSYLKVNYLNNL